MQVAKDSSLFTREEQHDNLSSIHCDTSIQGPSIRSYVISPDSFKETNNVDTQYPIALATGKVPCAID